MDPSIAAIASQFQVGTNYFRKAMSRLGPADLVKRAGPQSNPAIWIAGHLTQFRVRLGNILGEDREVPWGDLFATGSSIGELSKYPGKEEIDGTWTLASERLMTRLDQATGRSLDASPPMRIASGDGTLRGAIAYFAFHEAYHLGQLGFLVKWLGHAPLAD